jgi:hypothetical protein
MLARRTQLKLPDGTPCDLPLLVPSFSSKGFGFARTRGRGRPRQVSNIVVDLHEFAQVASQSVLISAYDLHFAHFDGSRDGKGSPFNSLQKSRLIFLDSGGYELAPDFDSCEPKTPSYAPRKGYGLEQYLKVLKRVAEDPAHRSFVISNFDWATTRRPLAKQIEAARRVFQSVPGQLTSFILKPWLKGQHTIEPERLSKKEFKSMAGFDVIGVTEKELGSSILERLTHIAQLRHELDVADNPAPIHVWGGLDPIMTPLYYFAGAQIFDGVSWLRYAYANGVAVNRECFSALSDEHGIGTDRDVCRQVISLKNRSMLNDLASALRTWVDGKGSDFTMFAEPVRTRLQQAYKTMVTEIPQLKEVQHGR